MRSRATIWCERRTEMMRLWATPRNYGDIERSAICGTKAAKINKEALRDLTVAMFHLAARAAGAGAIAGNTV